MSVVKWGSTVLVFRECIQNNVCGRSRGAFDIQKNTLGHITQV